jgi:hypothetical protein
MEQKRREIDATNKDEAANASGHEGREEQNTQTDNS